MARPEMACEPRQVRKRGSRAEATSWWGDVWCRFRRQRTSMIAATVLMIIILVSAFAPLAAPYDPTEQFRDEGLTELGGPVPPNSKFRLGTDGVGRDLLSRLVWGGRLSLAIGFAASVLIVVIALLVGGLAGYLGGTGDLLLMRFVDVVMSFPIFFMMLLLATMLRPGVWVVIVVISIFAWSYPARIFRSQMLAIKEREFVTAARCLGIPGPLIFVRHLLPHLLPLVIVYTALNLPTTIFAEASLSFVGRGVPPPAPSWGGMIRDGMNYYRVAPWVALYPGIAIALTVITTNLVGTGLREAMDPMRRGR